MTTTDSNPNNPASAFYLKTGDGEAYGPVDWETLIDWCCEGRIEPDHAISQDTVTWTNAADWPELAMDWMLVLADEEQVGPFHRKLIEELLATHPDPAPIAMVNRRSGERIPLLDPEAGPAEPDTAADNSYAADAISPKEPIPQAEQTSTVAPDEATDNTATVDADETDVPEEDVPELVTEESEPAAEASAAATPPPAPDSDTEHTAYAPSPTSREWDMQQAMDPDLPPSARIEMLSHQAAELREQYAQTRAAYQKLRTENTLLSDQNRHVTERLETAETERTTAESLLLEQQNQTAQHATECENLQARLDQMQDHYERLQAENQRQFEQIDDMRATALQREQHWKQELALLQTQLDAKARLLADIAGLLSQDGGFSPVAPEPEAADPEQPEPQNAPAAGAAAAHRHTGTEAQDPATTRGSQPGQPTRAPDGMPPIEHAIPARRWLAPVLILLMIGLFAALLLRQGCQPDSDPQPEPVSQSETPSASPAESRTTAQDVDTLPETEENLNLQPEDAASDADRTSDPIANLRAWPNISLPRAAVSTEGDTLQIVFSYGLFEAGTRLRADARSDLLELATQIRDTLNGFTIIVEGHTDTTPMHPENAAFVDNFALGMARAEAVKHYLSQQGGLPSESIQTASAGPASPPYPNDAPENRARNRTAVLRMIQ